MRRIEELLLKPEDTPEQDTFRVAGVWEGFVFTGDVQGPTTEQNGEVFVRGVLYLCVKCETPVWAAETPKECKNCKEKKQFAEYVHKDCLRLQKINWRPQVIIPDPIPMPEDKYLGAQLPVHTYMLDTGIDRSLVYLLIWTIAGMLGTLLWFGAL